MRKQMTAYKKWILELLEKEPRGTDWEKVDAEHLRKVGFYQHERLIHLIVTVVFALLEEISVCLLLATGNVAALTLTILFLVLLVPYIGHYYFLENTVQEFYLIHDRIRERIASGAKPLQDGE